MTKIFVAVPEKACTHLRKFVRRAVDLGEFVVQYSAISSSFVPEKCLFSQSDYYFNPLALGILIVEIIGMFFSTWTRINLSVFFFKKLEKLENRNPNVNFSPD